MPDRGRQLPCLSSPAPTHPALRNLVAETRLDVAGLVAPCSCARASTNRSRSSRCPGWCSTTRESLRHEVKELADLGIGAVILFGVPSTKDSIGSQAFDPEGIVQLCLADLAAEVGDRMVLIADLCVDEYTDHGHCGVLDGPADDPQHVGRQRRHPRDLRPHRGRPGHGRRPRRCPQRDDGRPGRRDPRRPRRGRIPSTSILAYSAKYASGLYGPFRDAVDVQIASGGNRKGYQQDFRNAREALVEIDADLAEGADMVMVKPALSYLDVIAAVRAHVNVPVAAYHVSGEYAMLKAAAANGWIDHDTVAVEHLTAIKRAGADVILTYLARWFAETQQ